MHKRNTPTLIYKRRFKTVIVLGIIILGFTSLSNSYAQGSLEPKMVAIKGGTFIMGQNTGEGDEKPEHEVVLHDFFIGKYEVTVLEYRAFCEATEREMPEEPEWGWVDNHPIINLSWNDASAYIEWLNIITKQAYRLPTEAEFEYVIRNGGESGIYPWGNGIPQNENLADLAFNVKTSSNRIWKEHNDGHAFIAPVGSFKPNKLGVYDINGNIWEWCQDWYGHYPSQKTTNPKGPETGTHKVGRGGSYNADPWHSRSASRAWVKPDFKKPGFRLAKNKK
ncbi:MAG: SUMF1/EgtB/PvdO family nonheme iron enzyme [Flavobacteriaceae bacterium]|nr:SUMF1/EgtB/PvdO family nonheme iron enzyme [Flavobacteriaceae bacterium]